MNLSTLAGFIGAGVVFTLSVFLSVSNPLIFLDAKSAIIVLGGTAAASLICFPLKQITALLKVFFRRMLGQNQKDFSGVIEQITILSKASLLGRKEFESATKKVQDPFLQDAAEMLFWARTEISEDELRDLLDTRAETHYKQYMSEAKIFKTMAKFPPAFGLMGTALGIIALLQSLGDPDARDQLGPAMAIALITTIYGLATANFLFIPVAENLVKQTTEDMVSRSIVIEGVMLIQQEKPTRYIEEKLKSFLLPSQRQGTGSAKR